MMKKLSKMMDLWREKEKELEYVNAFLVSDEQSHSQDAYSQYSKENTLT